MTRYFKNKRQTKTGRCISPRRSATPRPSSGSRGLVVHYDMDDGVVEAVNNNKPHHRQRRDTGLIGETGAGKTTVALSIMPICVPAERSHFVRGGTCITTRICSKKAQRTCSPYAAKKISMIIPGPDDGAHSGSQERHSGRRGSGDTQSDDDERKSKEIGGGVCCRVVGIPEERYDDYPFEFSGGMKQRDRPSPPSPWRSPAVSRLIIADEPTTALDVTIQCAGARSHEET